MIQKLNTLLIIFIIGFVSCKRNEELSVKSDDMNNISPSGFNYSTSKAVKINIRLLSNLGEPLVGIPVSIHTTKDTTELLYALTNKQGYIDTKLTLPSYVEQLTVKPHYTGLIKQLNTFIKNNSLDVVIGGSNAYSGNVVTTSLSSSSINNSQLVINSQFYQTNANTNYSFIGSYSGDGRPQYLTPTPGNVSADLLGFINSSLPEEKNVESHRLVYLSPNANRNIDVIEDGDVFITYVSEGATNENTIAYYTYPTNHKPTSVNDITDIKYLFPNSSGLASGGGLISGDRINLGNFKAGTSIGIVLLVNGWDKHTKTVRTNGVKFYSDELLNPETNVNLKKHTVVLNYEREDLLIIGFEDINREEGKSDHDFNDVVLYASSFPKTALSRRNVVKLEAPVDSDGDGISDDNDIHPGDSKKAYDTFYPSRSGWGTIAFEDNWPKKGDYDMNDLVVNFRYSYAVNANNQVTEMKADYKVNESLAYYKNGFGVELPISPSVIDDVRGYINSGKYIKYNINGTEAGQSKAVFIPFDNQKLIYNSSFNYSEPVRVLIEFLSPQPLHSLDPALYNPFLISDGRREYEIHLPGFAPTNLMGKVLFGTFEDRSKPNQGLYYIGENNWPWALQFLETFNFPSEGQTIDEKFPRFKEWAASGGLNFKDWYK